MSLTVAAHTSQVAMLRHAAVAAASESGASAVRQGDIALVISEAATNAVLHAYPDADGRGEIRLRIEIDDDGRLCLAVSDDGVGMRPRSDSPGLGLGLPLIAHLADDVCVTKDDGTTVTVRFALR